MEINLNHSRQKFSGHGLSADLIKRLDSTMIFHHTYLYRKDSESGTGVVHIHIIYVIKESEDSEEVSAAVFAGYFAITVDLKSFDGKIKNPMFCSSAVAYLVKYWLNQPVF